MVARSSEERLPLVPVDNNDNEKDNIKDNEGIYNDIVSLTSTVTNNNARRVQIKYIKFNNNVNEIITQI